MSDTSCWGCAREPGIDGTLGARCRTQLAQRRTDPATPRLNAMVERLADVYSQLCWNCEVELAAGISGLCPGCEAELRR
jgi:hypothetical protein